jgi:hypothetical protein
MAKLNFQEKVPAPCQDISSPLLFSCSSSKKVADKNQL